MSTDIQIVSVVDDLQVISVEDIQGATPRSLRVVGIRGFNSTQEVLINDMVMRNYILVSDTILLVEPGSALDSLPVESLRVNVVSSTLTSSGKVRLIFGPTASLRTVTGTQKLVQHIVRVLLTSVGSNRFNVGDGGGLLRLTAFPLTPASKPKLMAGLSHAISMTEAQIVEANSSVRGLPLDERLLSLKLASVRFDDVTLAVQATIKLTTYAGTVLTVPLVL